jgi:hypothetical protein
MVENNNVDESTGADEEVEFVDSYEEFTFTELKADADERKIDRVGVRTKKALIKLLEKADKAEDKSTDVEGGKADEVLKQEKKDAEGGVRPKHPADVDPASLDNPDNPDQAAGDLSGSASAHARPTQDALEAGSGEAPLTKAAESIDVIIGDYYIRTYSKEMHGGNYKELAKGFVGKVEGRKLEEVGKITWLKVVYKKQSKIIGTFYSAEEVFKGKNFKNDALAFSAQVRGTVHYR